MTVDTNDLIRRHQRGQPGAMDALFNRYKDYVYRIAFFMTRNSGDAEEVVQETFIDVLRALPRYDVNGPARFETWLYRVTINRCQMRLRRQHFPSADWDEVAEQVERIVNGHTHHNPEAATLHRERAAALWRAVDSIPDAHREVIILRYQAGLSYAEIAQVLKLDQGTVKSRLHHAHKKLEAILTQAEAVRQPAALNAGISSLA
jgi:RNA polymerase sigma-70 factor (ECF subfamily)